jgi:hypothetical protein
MVMERAARCVNSSDLFLPVLIYHVTDWVIEKCCMLRVLSMYCINLVVMSMT